MILDLRFLGCFLNLNEPVYSFSSSSSSSLSEPKQELAQIKECDAPCIPLHLDLHFLSPNEQVSSFSFSSSEPKQESAQIKECDALCIPWCLDPSRFPSRFLSLDEPVYSFSSS